MCSGYLPIGAEDDSRNPSNRSEFSEHARPVNDGPLLWGSKTCVVCKVEAQEDESIFCFGCHDIGRAMQRERMAELVMGMAVPKADHA